MQLTPALSGASFALAMFAAYGFHAMVADPPDSDVNETLATSAFLFFSLTINGDYIVTGVEVIPLFPALLVLLLVLSATVIAWRREGE